jgi:hypothetical protein
VGIVMVIVGGIIAIRKKSQASAVDRTETVKDEPPAVKKPLRPALTP